MKPPQPAQSGFRYFKDADGDRWKMPANGKYGFVWSEKAGGWIEWAVTLEQVMDEAVMKRDGTVETDEHGTPLAPAALPLREIHLIEYPNTSLPVAIYPSREDAMEATGARMIPLRLVEWPEGWNPPAPPEPAPVAPVEAREWDVLTDLLNDFDLALLKRGFSTDSDLRSAVCAANNAAVAMNDGREVTGGWSLPSVAWGQRGPGTYRLFRDEGGWEWCAHVETGLVFMRHPKHWLSAPSMSLGLLERAKGTTELTPQPPTPA